MSIDTCIEEYKKLAKKVFRPRKRRYFGGSRLWNVFGYPTFNAKNLEDAIKEILKSVKPPLSEDAMLMDEGCKCKMWVVLMTKP